MSEINCLGYADDELLEQAQRLASDLQLDLVKQASHCLFLSQEGLALKFGDFSLLRADFSLAKWAKRKAAGKKQGLIKACKPGPGLKIMDVTAGWGRDAAILASFGAKVIMIERNPIMAALLRDALERRSVEDKQLMDLSVVFADAKAYLSQLSEDQLPDVIYMDPMHPERDKSALVKKDMQVLQELIGSDKDAAELLDSARYKIRQRVVVKWPQKQQPLAKPTSSIEGKTVRFDVFTSAL